MKKLVFYFYILALTNSSIGQNAAKLYRASDSLYKIKEYKNAAVTYSQGVRTEGKSASLNRYVTTASRWALAGEKDSAFDYLNVISTSPKTNKVIARNVEFDVDFLSIQKDKRWPITLRTIQKQAEKNSYPQEEFIYGRKDGIALTLVCIKPRSTNLPGQLKVKPNGKAIIYVVSGSWFSSYNGIEVSTNAAEQYLAKGYTVFAVMHGSQPRYAIPDALSDLRRAVRYVRYNAAKFNIDPNRIGITGTSAGGHLSLLIATADDNINTGAPDPVDRVSSRVQAVAVLFPPTDLLNWGGPGFNFVNAKELIKPSKVWGAVDFKIWNEKFALYEEVTDTSTRNKIGKEISPIYFVSPDDPPVFIIHGDADMTVPLQQSKNIISLFNEAGVINRFIIKKGGKHNGDDMNPEWQEFVVWFDKYLK